MGTEHRKKTSYFIAITQALATLCILSGFTPAFSKDPGTESRSGQFSREEEFPNLFLPVHLRNRPLSSFKASERKEYAARKQQIEKVLASIYERLQVPFFNEAKGKPEMDFLFARLEKEVRRVEEGLIKTSPQKYRAGLGATIDPSGGVVRASLAYIYETLYEAETKGLGFEDVIQTMLADKSPLPGSRLRGVGSDFDVYASHLADVEHFNAIQGAVKDLVHQVESHYGLLNSDLQDGVKRSLLTVLDVKPLLKIGDTKGQLERSVKGGGADTDWLYFQRNAGVIREPDFKFEDGEKIPEKNPHIVDDILTGTFSYYPGQAENSDRQTIRGLRPFIEMPWLRLDTKSEKIFVAELQELLKRIQQKKAALKDSKTEPTVPQLIDPQGHQQFEKIARNAQFGMAHNWIWRDTASPVAVLAKQIVTELGGTNQGKGGEIPLIPPYADRFALSTSQVRMPKAEIPPEYLIDSGTWRKSLAEGRLWHGTPSLNVALSILRGSLRETFYEKDFRRGPYTSPHRSYSMAYMTEQGTVLPLDIRTDVVFKVFDLQKASDEWKKKILAEAKAAGIEASDLLTRKYGVDVIVLSPDQVLVKNTAALKPAKFRDVVSAYRSFYENPALSPMDRFQAFSSYQRLAPLAVDLGEQEIHIPKASEFVAAFSEQDLRKIDPSVNPYALLNWDPSDPKERTILLKNWFLRPMPDKSAFLEFVRTRPEFQYVVENPDSDFARALYRQLVKEPSQESRLLQKILSTSEPKSDLRTAALRVLSGSRHYELEQMFERIFQSEEFVKAAFTSPHSDAVLWKGLLLDALKEPHRHGVVPNILKALLKNHADVAKVDARLDDYIRQGFETIKFDGYGERQHFLSILDTPAKQVLYDRFNGPFVEMLKESLNHYQNSEYPWDPRFAPDRALLEELAPKGLREAFERLERQDKDHAEFTRRQEEYQRYSHLYSYFRRRANQVLPPDGWTIAEHPKPAGVLLDQISVITHYAKEGPRETSALFDKNATVPSWWMKVFQGDRLNTKERKEKQLALARKDPALLYLMVGAPVERTRQEAIQVLSENSESAREVVRAILTGPVRHEANKRYESQIYESGTSALVKAILENPPWKAHLKRAILKGELATADIFTEKLWDARNNRTDRQLFESLLRRDTDEHGRWIESLPPVDWSDRKEFERRIRHQQKIANLDEMAKKIQSNPHHFWNPELKNLTPRLRSWIKSAQAGHYSILSAAADTADEWVKKNDPKLEEVLRTIPPSANSKKWYVVASAALRGNERQRNALFETLLSPPEADFDMGERLPLVLSANIPGDYYDSESGNRERAQKALDAWLRRPEIKKEMRGRLYKVLSEKEGLYFAGQYNWDPRDPQDRELFAQWLNKVRQQKSSNSDFYHSGSYVESALQNLAKEDLDGFLQHYSALPEFHAHFDFDNFAYYHYPPGWRMFKDVFDAIAEEKELSDRQNQTLNRLLDSKLLKVYDAILFRKDKARPFIEKRLKNASAENLAFVLDLLAHGQHGQETLRQWIEEDPKWRRQLLTRLSKPDALPAWVGAFPWKDGEKQSQEIRRHFEKAKGGPARLVGYLRRLGLSEAQISQVPRTPELEKLELHARFPVEPSPYEDEDSISKAHAAFWTQHPERPVQMSVTEKTAAAELWKQPLTPGVQEFYGRYGNEEIRKWVVENLSLLPRFLELRDTDNVLAVWRLLDGLPEDRKELLKAHPDFVDRLLKRVSKELPRPDASRVFRHFPWNWENLRHFEYLKTHYAKFPLGAAERLAKLEGEITLRFPEHSLWKAEFPDVAFQKAYRRARHDVEREDDLKAVLTPWAMEHPSEAVTHFPGLPLPHWEEGSTFQSYKKQVENLSFLYEEFAKRVGGAEALTDADNFLVDRLLQEKSLGFMLFAGRFGSKEMSQKSLRTLLEMDSIAGLSPLIWIARKIETAYEGSHMGWLPARIEEALEGDTKLRTRLLRGWVDGEPSQKTQESLPLYKWRPEIAGLVKEKVSGKPPEQRTEAQKQWIARHGDTEYFCAGRYATLLKKARAR